MINLKKIIIMVLLTSMSLTTSAWAAKASFSDGPVIKGYGKHIAVDQDLQIPKDMKFKVAFDISKQGGHDKVNRSFNSIARFINMHVANGVPIENIELALVIHGTASFDVINNSAYLSRFKKANPNHELLALLMKNKVDIYICGQSAAFHGIDKNQLQTGVKMALSAMTTHAVLHKQGYSVNPF